jgi:uncharacterized protein (TIGR04255 family)
MFTYMGFPDSDRVIYKKNPLREVVCQLNFPAILRIDSEPPYKFQEAVKDSFPNYNEAQTASFQLQFPTMEKPQNLFRGKNAYKFTSDDGNWTTTLTRDSLSLASTAYISWSDFQTRFDKPLDAFVHEYSPLAMTRLGLRYINIIDRGALGLEAYSWGELLAKHIAGELADPDIGGMVVTCANQLTLKEGNGETQIVLNHGLIGNENNDSAAYLIDSDYSTAMKTEVDDVRKRLKDFNNNSGKLFRWCISNELHEFLEPVASSTAKQPA